MKNVIFALSLAFSGSAFACTHLLNPTHLRPAEIQIIDAHAKGVMSVEEFLKSPPLPGYLLGLSEPQKDYQKFLDASGLQSWETAYKRFGVGQGQTRHTEIFMDALTRGEGYSIVFLLPKNLWNHPEGVHTKREMWWLLKHPKRMSKVIFIFEDREIF